MPQEPPKLHPDVQAFVDALARIETLLLPGQNPAQLAFTRKVLRMARNSDGACVELYLASFAGMGRPNEGHGFGPGGDALERESQRARQIAESLR